VPPLYVNARLVEGKGIGRKLFQFQPEMDRLDINYAAKIPTKAITDALCGLESHNSQEVLSVFDIILRQHTSRKSVIWFPCNVDPIRVNDQYMTNILLKINGNLGGLNSVLTSEHGLNILVICKALAKMFGMNVSHGSPGQADAPSISVVIYLYELLLDFYTSSGKRKPYQIIVFRGQILLSSILKCAMYIPQKYYGFAWAYHLLSRVGRWTQGYDGLTFVLVRGAGHEVPLYRPQLALVLVKAFLSGTAMPTLPQVITDY
ncbi:hypothetical protein GIB67_016285, partial [Kingdonia uniflora]